MRPFLHFFWTALKNPRQVSTLFQTGLTASEVMSRALPNPCNLVIELGVGTGAITQSLLRKVSSPEGYLGIELNPDMIEFAQERFPQLRIVNDTAENFPKYLGGRKVSGVVSSLPWSLMPAETVTNTLNAVYDNLEEQGVFATYLTVHVLKTSGGRRMQAKLQEKFSRLESQVVFENLPPVKIFIAKK